jgi:hypothetical protein
MKLRGLTWGTQNDRDRVKQAFEAVIRILDAFEKMGEDTRNEQISEAKR